MAVCGVVPVAAVVPFFWLARTGTTEGPLLYVEQSLFSVRYLQDRAFDVCGGRVKIRQAFGESRLFLIAQPSARPIHPRAHDVRSHLCSHLFIQYARRLCAAISAGFCALPPCSTLPGSVTVSRDLGFSCRAKGPIYRTDHDLDHFFYRSCVLPS